MVEGMNTSQDTLSIITACPYCQFENVLRVAPHQLPFHMAIVNCEQEEGGCDVHYAVRISVEKAPDQVLIHATTGKIDFMWKKRGLPDDHPENPDRPEGHAETIDQIRDCHDPVLDTTEEIIQSTINFMRPEIIEKARDRMTSMKGWIAIGDDARIIQEGTEGVWVEGSVFVNLAELLSLADQKERGEKIKIRGPEDIQ